MPGNDKGRTSTGAALAVRGVPWFQFFLNRLFSGNRFPAM